MTTLFQNRDQSMKNIPALDIPIEFFSVNFPLKVAMATTVITE